MFNGLICLGGIHESISLSSCHLFNRNKSTRANCRRWMNYWIPQSITCRFFRAGQRHLLYQPESRAFYDNPKNNIDEMIQITEKKEGTAIAVPSFIKSRLFMYSQLI